MRTARDGENQLRKKKQQKDSRQTKVASPKEKRRVHAGTTLSNADQEELGRACKKGYLTLDGRNAGHGSLTSLCSSSSLKGSKLAAAHRKWCDDGNKPNIVLYKASGRSREVLDHIVIDLSTLRNQLLDLWRSDILEAAMASGMVLKAADESDECELEYDARYNGEELSQNYSDSIGSHLPIAELPFVSMGLFVGERSQAKAMAKNLARLWDIPEPDDFIILDGDEDTTPPAKKKKSHKGGRYQNNHGKVGKVIKAKDVRRAQRRQARKDESVCKFYR